MELSGKSLSAPSVGGSSELSGVVWILLDPFCEVYLWAQSLRLISTQLLSEPAGRAGEHKQRDQGKGSKDKDLVSIIK